MCVSDAYKRKIKCKRGQKGRKNDKTTPFKRKSDPSDTTIVLTVNKYNYYWIYI